MATSHKSSPSSVSAAKLIKQAGHRVTDARTAVLDILLTAEHALTHQEIEQSLAQRKIKIDRVTLYRVLDWALKQSLAHKVTGEDRTWRFNATTTHHHAHFNCVDCGQIYCLEDLAPAIAVKLPEGFNLQHAEVAVQGLCPQCNH